MSQTKLSALASLLRDGTTNARTLSERMTIRPQSLTRVLADLESEGLVTRSRAAEDRREHVLRLTPAGVEVMRQEGLRRDALVGAVMQHALTRTEIELLAIAGRILEKMADRWTTFVEVSQKSAVTYPSSAGP